MELPPLVLRELRVALRKKRPVASRFRMAAIASSVAQVLILWQSLSGIGKVGSELHGLLFLLGLFVVVRTPLLTAGMFAEERRSQTMGLLFLSGLSIGEVFLSKLLSAALIAFTDLLAIAPVLALPFLNDSF